MKARAADCDVTAYVQPSSAAAFSETLTAFGHLIVLSHKCPVAFVLVRAAVCQVKERGFGRFGSFRGVLP